MESFFTDVPHGLTLKGNKILVKHNVLRARIGRVLRLAKKVKTYSFGPDRQR